MTLLNTSSSALLAFQRALDTISHNVANAATAGYSRQRVELAAVPGSVAHGFGYVGDGVEVTGVTRAADQFLLARRMDSLSETGRLDSLATLSARLDTALTDAGSGLGKPWSAFFDASQGVASQPASTAARQALLDSAGDLAARFRGLDGQIAGLDREIDTRLAAGMAETNRLAANLAKLNEAIMRQQGLAAGQAPNDLLDQREQLAGELGRLVGATTLIQDDGSMSVFTPGGQALVMGTQAASLTTLADPYRPTRLEPAQLMNGSTARLGGNVLSGEMGGLLEFRRNVLDPAAEQLGRIATSLVSSVNAQHREGMDLYGQLGGNFFTPITPATSAHSANTGSASLGATLADPAALDGADVVLSYNGSAWSAASRATGAPLPLSGAGTAASPLRVGGVDVVVSGAAAAGDRFLLQPASGAAGRVQVALTDTARIAAAAPVAATAALTNLGKATPDSLSVDNAANPALLAATAIVFPTATTYTLNGSAPFAYNASVGIVGYGWTLKLSGTPVAGDRFDVTSRGPNSSDNGNARQFATLDGGGLLDGGSTSLKGALGQLTVQAGMAARQAESSRDAQAAVHARLDAEQAATAGVNLDEEAANMLRYQQAYQAAAQMVATADTLFQTLLAAVRQ